MIMIKKMNKKVILVLIDGMRPDALELTEEKYLLALAEESSSCLKGSSVMPSVTLPCHCSLFFSVDPERHGITTNTWMPPVRPISSIMDTAKAAGLKTAMFYNWEWLRDLNRPGSLDHSDFNVLKLDYHNSISNFSGDIAAEQAMTDRAMEYIDTESPDLTFIYLGLTDEAGHYFGWMSDEYIQSVTNAESCIKKLRGHLDDGWQIIITADHGGHGKDHGHNIPEDMTIPMIFSGNAFANGKKFPEANLKDISPTIAKILGLKRAPEWVGKELI